jgi:hypothetical protein
LLIDTINNIDQFILSDDNATEEKEKLLQVLIYLVKSKSLAKTIRDDYDNLSTNLQDVAFRLDKHTSGGALHDVSGKLVMEVQTVFGFKTSAPSN